MWSRVLHTLLCLCLLSRLVECALLQSLKTWMYFEFYEDESCWYSETIAIHGVMVGVCLHDERFLSVWDGGVIANDTLSFSFSYAEGSNLFAGFHLERFNDTSCSFEASQGITFVPTYSFDEEPFISPGNWGVNGCGVNPMLVGTAQVQRGISLQARKDRYPPMIGGRHKVFMEMTFSHLYSDTDCENLKQPTNFSVYRPFYCFSRDNASSLMITCPLKTSAPETYVAPKISFYDNAFCEEGTARDMNYTGQCGVDDFHRYLDFTLPTADANQTELYFSMPSPTASPVSFPLITGEDGFVSALHRQDCITPIMSMNIWTTSEPTSMPTVTHSPTLAPTARIYPSVNLSYAFVLEPIFDAGVVNDSAIERQIEELVCDALGVPVRYCEVVQETTDLMASSQPSSRPTAQPVSINSVQTNQNKIKANTNINSNEVGSNIDSDKNSNANNNNNNNDGGSTGRLRRNEHTNYNINSVNDNNNNSPRFVFVPPPLLSLLVTVNISLNPVDFPQHVNNATALAAHATDVLLNIKQTAAWTYFEDNVITLRTDFFNFVETTLSSPEVMSYYPSSSSFTPIGAPIGGVTTSPSLRPSESSPSSSSSSSESRGLTTTQTIWISLSAGLVVVHWWLIYLYCIAKKKFKFGESTCCGSDQVLPMD